MKKLRNIFFLLVTLVFALTSCGARTPEKLVKSELELIKKLDEKTITNFVSYEDIVQTKSRGTDIGEETTEAVKLFFQNFDYEILSTVSNEDTATVTVSIQNLDASALAHDLCLTLLKKSVVPEADDSSGMKSYFTILRDILKNNTYEMKTTEAHFELVRLSGGWSIQNTVALEDELVGGLITHLNDPYLLTPKEVAEATFQAFQDFSPEEWAAYLDMHDVFAIGSSLSDDVDQSLASQIARHFSYSITQLKINEDGNTANAHADITSLDMTSVFNSYKEKLLRYAETTESVRASDSEIADKSALFLKEALDANDDTILCSVPLSFTNNGSSWEMTFGEEFVEILLGGSAKAVASFMG